MGLESIIGRFLAWFERFRESLGTEEPFDEVFVTYDPIEAEMLKDVLEGGSIKVVLRSAKVTPFPVNVGKTGEIRVLVPKDESEAAKKLIESLNKPA